MSHVSTYLNVNSQTCSKEFRTRAETQVYITHSHSVTSERHSDTLLSSASDKLLTQLSVCLCFWSSSEILFLEGGRKRKGVRIIGIYPSSRFPVGLLPTVSSLLPSVFCPPPSALCLVPRGERSLKRNVYYDFLIFDHF
ncbi:30S ribosomal protein S11 [Frankliniella fusca]|uniref:30S ribosomal protein S11 n=1 Tax=Frankliniella fusca TaxID=407009 RepID=A0AAE1LBS3_9NEOP|nr:30S ribosomal protein S11 [Frankliniella fusca]